VIGEFDHAQGGIVELEERGSERHRDRSGEPDPSDRSTGTFADRSASHAPDQQKNERDPPAGLHQCAQGHDRHSRQLLAPDHERESAGDGQSNQEIVVAARNRLEQDHRIRSERRHGEDGESWPDPAGG